MPFLNYHQSRAAIFREITHSRGNFEIRHPIYQADAGAKSNLGGNMSEFSVSTVPADDLVLFSARTIPQYVKD